MDTVLNIRTDREIRSKAGRIFSSLGISTSAGINMFLYQVVRESGLPFTPTIDSKKIRERWDAQVAQAKRGKKYLDAKSVLRGL